MVNAIGVCMGGIRDRVLYLENQERQGGYIACATKANDVQQEVQEKATQELSGTPNHWHFLQILPVQMAGVLQYKWEAYCGTIWRRIAVFPFLQSLETKQTQRYKS